MCSSLQLVVLVSSCFQVSCWSTPSPKSSGGSRMVGTVMEWRMFPGLLHAPVAGLPTAVAHRELAEKHAFKEAARFSRFEFARLCVHGQWQDITPRGPWAPQKSATPRHVTLNLQTRHCFARSRSSSCTQLEPIPRVPTPTRPASRAENANAPRLAQAATRGIV